MFLTRSFARFSSSPARMTTDVVPSPTSRSWSSASSTRIYWVDRSRRRRAGRRGGGAREAGDPVRSGRDMKKRCPSRGGREEEAASEPKVDDGTRARSIGARDRAAARPAGRADDRDAYLFVPIARITKTRTTRGRTRARRLRGGRETRLRRGVLNLEELEDRRAVVRDRDVADVVHEHLIEPDGAERRLHDVRDRLDRHDCEGRGWRGGSGASDGVRCCARGEREIARQVGKLTDGSIDRSFDRSRAHRCSSGRLVRSGVRHP